MHSLLDDFLHIFSLSTVSSHQTIFFCGLTFRTSSRGPSDVLGSATATAVSVVVAEPVETTELSLGQGE
jgi:hypothetical protein